MVTVSAELAEIHAWWAHQPDSLLPLAGGPHHQAAEADNPYWEIVRWLPAPDGRPDGITRGLPVGHHLLTRRYAWAITSPGDIAWLRKTTGDRGLVEVGAGSGYWAWQAHQAGIDVIAYEPADPAVNAYTDGTEYFPLKRDDHEAARHHPDRALLLCWPSADEPWAADALRAYAGDLLVYVGQDRGGHCADDGFFDLLDQKWTRIDTSTAHVGWRHTHSAMTAYRRR
jgi:hypothetical protein